MMRRLAGLASTARIVPRKVAIWGAVALVVGVTMIDVAADAVMKRVGLGGVSTPKWRWGTSLRFRQFSPEEDCDDGGQQIQARRP